MFIEESRREWNSSNIAPAKAKLKCMKECEHQLVIGGDWFELVQVMLSNVGHFTGVTIVHGKYLYFDGIPSTKLRWIAASESFESLGDYRVCGFWYRRCYSNEDDTLLEENHANTNADHSDNEFIPKDSDGNDYSKDDKATLGVTKKEENQ